MPSAWGHPQSLTFKKELCRASRGSGILAQILEILATNHREDQHFLSNILGFSLSWLEVRPSSMNTKGIVTQNKTKPLLSIKSFSSPVLGGGSGTNSRHIPSHFRG